LGWFRLFDRMRLRPETASLEGWGLPGSRLRLTDPHLASYFRELAGAAGVDVSVGGFDVVSHMLARSAEASPGRWHLDLRLIGMPARLLFGGDSAHTIVSWHAPNQRATLQLPGRRPVDLEGVDLLALCEGHLELRDLATLSAFVPDAVALGQWLHRLEPYLSRQTRAVIRLPGEALGGLVSALPNWPVKPVALLPCEGEPVEGDSEPRMDLLLCLEALSARAAEDVAPVPATQAAPLTYWHDLQPPPMVSGGFVVSALEDSYESGGLLIALLGDVPTTAVGAEMFRLQTNPLQAVRGAFRRFDLHAARLRLEHGALVASTVAGMATVDPYAMTADGAAPDLSPPGAARTVCERPALLLSDCDGREAALATMLPRLELASELIEREKLGADGVEIVCPHGLDEWTREMLALFGFGDAAIRSDVESVLFRHVILATEIASLDAARRSATFDRFWRRVASEALPDARISLTAPRPTGKVLIAGAAGGIINRADLAQLGRERRYAVVDPALARPAEIAGLLRDASVVIAPSRLGIWSAFARRCALGLLHSDTEQSLPYAALHAAGARRHSAVAMFGSGAGDNPEAGFLVATDRLAALMDRLEAMADGMRRGGAA
jgi:hypothetical protein